MYSLYIYWLYMYLLLMFLTAVNTLNLAVYFDMNSTLTLVLSVLSFWALHSSIELVHHDVTRPPPIWHKSIGGLASDGYFSDCVSDANNFFNCLASNVAAANNCGSTLSLFLVNDGPVYPLLKEISKEKCWHLSLTFREFDQHFTQLATSLGKKVAAMTLMWKDLNSATLLKVAKCWLQMYSNVYK